MKRRESSTITKRELWAWGVIAFMTALFVLPPLTWPKPISIGSVGDAPNEEIKKFLSLANYLAKQLQSEGFDQGKVVVARSIPEMAALLRDGKIDLYVDSPFPTVAVSRLTGSKLLLRRWKQGISDYYTVIFARVDSGINRPEDLKGRMMALKDLSSSSGYFLPKMVLTQRGLKLVLKKDAFDPVKPGEVGYVFSNSEENGMVWVLRGKVSAGAMDNQRYLQQAGRSLNSLKTIYKTFSVPRHIVSYRADLSSELVARIKEIMIQMDQSEEGRRALRDFEGTSKFDELPNQAMAPFFKTMKFIDAEFGIK